MYQIKISRTPGNEDIPLPERMSVGASGYDLFAAIREEVLLQPGERLLVPTGICIALPEGMEAQVRPRSGLALKHGITVLNSPGTIDADYRGEIGVILINLGDESFTVTRKQRIAQLVFQRVVSVEWDVVHMLPDTERGGGGFGHTGQ